MRISNIYCEDDEPFDKHASTMSTTTVALEDNIGSQRKHSEMCKITKDDPVGLLVNEAIKRNLESEPPDDPVFRTMRLLAVPGGVLSPAFSALTLRAPFTDSQLYKDWLV